MMKSYTVENLDHYGRGIVREGGKPIFVVDALPEEEINLQITVEKSKFSEGTVLKRNNDSKMRVTPICPHYSVCGGCDLMHMSYLNQLKYKENKVKEIMSKFVGVNCINQIVGTNELNYRNKLTLHVNDKVGLYKKKSYEIICIDECFIVNKKINALIKSLNGANLTNVAQIVIRSTKQEIMLIFYLNGKIEQEIVQKFNFVDSLVAIQNNDVKVIHGKAFIEEEIDGFKFIVSPLSFFQVNPDGMSKIYNKALEYADIKNTDKVLDLYCGTGTIGIYAARKAKEVLGIELNKDAIKDADKNKMLNNLSNISFKSGDVKNLLNFDSFKPSIIFVDPPRSGLDKMVINKLLNYTVDKLIYISCDPVTLARDLNLLKEKYNILEITPFDMFPNTYHVECVCLLTRK